MKNIFSSAISLIHNIMASSKQVVKLTTKDWKCLVSEQNKNFLKSGRIHFTLNQT